jgi:hypothetical protein
MKNKNDNLATTCRRKGERPDKEMKNSSFKFKNVTSLLDVVDVDVDDEKGKH